MHTLVTVNSTAVDMGVQVSVREPVSILWGVDLGEEGLGWVVILCLTL